MVAAFITTRLGDEDRRGASLQARGLAVITTSGALVTLLAALAKLGGPVNVDSPPTVLWIKSLFAIAIVLFVLAAIAGMVANSPRETGRPHIAQLTSALRDHWNDNGAAAEKSVALARAEALEKLEKSNDVAARAVLCAVTLEVAAISVGAAAVVVLIFGS